MQWEYLIEEIIFGQPIANLQDQLNEVGGGGWEAVAAWPDGKSEGHIFILFKKLKSK